MFQTGLYPTETGCFRNNIALPSDTRTVANYFADEGYETAYVGKWHLASDGEQEEVPKIDYRTKAIPPERRGGYTGFWRAADVLEFTSNGYGGYVYDENMRRIDFSGYRVDCITNFALEFLDVRDSARPFFLTISTLEPHHQNDSHHYEGPEGSKERFKDFDTPGDLAPFDGDYKEEYPDYLGACQSVDHNLGRVIQKLKDLGIYEDTVIIFSSDHGCHFRTRNTDSHLNGFDDYKRSGHDSSLRVPLVIRGGKYLGGQVVEKLVSTLSLPKTILSIAGIDVGNKMRGEDLIDIAKNPPENRKDQVFAQISESRVGRVIRTPGYTYAVYAPGLNGGEAPGSDNYADDYLYDLEKDPDQITNLIDDPSYNDQKALLRDSLVSWIREVENREVAIE